MESGLDGVVDGLADAGKIFPHLPIGEPQHLDAYGLQTPGADPIIFYLGRLVMLGTVQFDGQIGPQTEKIHNIIS